MKVKEFFKNVTENLTLLKTQIYSYLAHVLAI